MTDRLNKIWDRLIQGWPVYVAVSGFLFAYSELWIEKKIREGITAQTGANISTQVALNTDAVNDLGSDVQDLTNSVETLNTDVKDTLRILATK
jgi:hypothetical protein